MNFVFLILCSFLYPVLSVKPKICINCKHFIPDNGTGEFGKCSLFLRPDYDNSFLVNGNIKEKKDYYYYCSSARGNGKMCGLEGKMYKQKYNKK